MTLECKPFEVMMTAEKRQEFRQNTAFWQTRLFDAQGKPRKYSQVEFRNGYNANDPLLRCEFLGVSILPAAQQLAYSNGLEVCVPQGALSIRLGRVLKVQGADVVKRRCQGTAGRRGRATTKLKAAAKDAFGWTPQEVQLLLRLAPLDGGRPSGGWSHTRKWGWDKTRSAKTGFPMRKAREIEERWEALHLKHIL